MILDQNSLDTARAAVINQCRMNPYNAVSDLEILLIESYVEAEKVRLEGKQ